MNNILVVTTNEVPNTQTLSVYGFVTSDVITGINVIRDIGAGFRNFFGGRSGGYEKELNNAKTTALNELTRKASNLGANAIVGLKIDVSPIGGDSKGGMLLVSAIGTAVKVK